jgi:hypothetical protein
VREANANPTPYKVCVLGLWVAKKEEGKKIIDLAIALESGR